MALGANCELYFDGQIDFGLQVIMAISPATGMEPIPGYCLAEKVGDGGFGEVWRVTAPGGLSKALKIIYGDIRGARAEQEMKSLERIKAVRHPFLLSLERFEVVDGRLLIVTELAERSLFDRFTECRAAGLRGVPRDELLGYLRDTAEALDYLSETHSLQHLDIKPQNLLLLSGRIKVADFGLVKNLMGSSATITGGVTPVYAAPELFDGRISRFSDQYSLAVVYQELLTSVRPFPGATAFQLATQHNSGRPFLSPLPESDHPVITRALSKVPEHRFPSCREMVECLSRLPAPAAPSAKQTVPPQDLVEEPSPAPTALLPADLEPPDTPRPSGNSPTPDSWRALPDTATGTPGLRPTLFLGIGGIAGTTLRLLRRRMRSRLGDLAALPIFQMFLLDTDRAAICAAQEGSPDQALAPDDTLLCPLQRPDGYRSQSQALRHWLDPRWLHAIPRSLRPEGLRPLGRLALLDNAEAVLGRLRTALSRLDAESSRVAAVGATGRPLRDDAPRIFVVASIAGCTGGGMLWDVAYAVRQILRELNLPDTGVCGVLLYATGSSPDQQCRARVNTQATLLELDHWCRPNVSFPGAPEKGLAGFGPGSPPFDECYLVHLGDGLTENETAREADRVAEYLCLDASAGGACLDRLRQESRWPGALRSFRLAGADYAHGLLVERASHLLCRRLVQRCLGDVTDDDRARRKQEVDRQLAALRLEVQPMAEILFKALGDFLAPESGPAFATTNAAPTPPPGEESIQRMLQEIENLFGTVGQPRTEEGSKPGTARPTLLDKARNLGEQLGRHLAERLLDTVENPDGRLKAAECSLDHILLHLRKQMDDGQIRLDRSRLRGQNLRRQLLKRAASGQAGALRWIDVRRLCYSIFLPDSEESLAHYCWQRHEEIALEGALAVLEMAYTQLAPLQDLKTYRERVARFIDLFYDGPAERDLPPAGILPLLPFGADTLASAAEALVEQLPAETMREIEDQFQDEVLNPRGGLLGVVGNPVDRLHSATAPSSTTVRFWDTNVAGRQLANELREQLYSRARAVVVSALAGMDAAGLFFERHGNAEQARQTIRDVAAVSRVQFSQANAAQYALLALPSSQSGRDLRDLASEALEALPLTVVEGYEGVILIQETAGLNVPAVITALCSDDPQCAELATLMRTRIDVVWSDASPQRLPVER
jgi:serine/threonine protein kinase